MLNYHEKIFCIGLNKTGTTSIGDALSILGYNRLGWRPNLSPQLTLRWHEKNLEQLIGITNKFNAFEDIPWCFVYKEMAEIYPNAKFILTIRKDTDTWLKSITKHMSGKGNWVGHYLIYSSYDPENDKDLYTSRYEAHNEQAAAFFKDMPQKFLTMCFENNDGWSKLCDFLGFSTMPNLPFPHSNKSQTL